MRRNQPQWRLHSVGSSEALQALEREKTGAKALGKAYLQLLPMLRVIYLVAALAEVSHTPGPALDANSQPRNHPRSSPVALPSGPPLL